ncbi:hypothetical protein B0H19DRAFT_1068478 [Mycena capillaripes]|nr:hypothetical protein B0H19DRAFT_1068478 [Mycena capillaripes]
MTIHEVPDEDDILYLTSKSNTSLDSLDSHGSGTSEIHTEDPVAFAAATATDPAAQDVFACVHGPLTAPGKLRKAPTIPSAAAAVKDLTAAPQGKLRGLQEPTKIPNTILLTHHMRTLCQLARQYIHDRKLLLVNPHGDWKESLIANEDLAVDIKYLQEMGNDITAEKLVKYLARPEVMEKHGITKTITVRTARRYLNILGYRYSQPQKG